MLNDAQIRSASCETSNDEGGDPLGESARPDPHRVFAYSRPTGDLHERHAVLMEG